MYNSNDGEQHLILNLPKDLNFKDLFPTFTTKQLYATQFIVNQINHFSFYKKRQGYSFNVATHAKFLGITRNMVYTIIKVLTENNIVEMVQNYKVGERNRCFKTVMPYSDANSIQIFFRRSEPKNYKFINEFINNGYRITPNDENIIQQKEIIVEEKNRIQHLEQEIRELKEALNKALGSIRKPEQVNQQVIIENSSQEIKSDENDVVDVIAKFSVDDNFEDLKFDDTDSEIEDSEFKVSEECIEAYRNLTTDQKGLIKKLTFDNSKINIDENRIAYVYRDEILIA